MGCFDLPASWASTTPEFRRLVGGECGGLVAPKTLLDATSIATPGQERGCCFVVHLAANVRLVVKGVHMDTMWIRFCHTTVSLVC